MQLPGKQVGSYSSATSAAPEHLSTHETTYHPGLGQSELTYLLHAKTHGSRVSTLPIQRDKQHLCTILNTATTSASSYKPQSASPLLIQLWGDHSVASRSSPRSRQECTSHLYRTCGGDTASSMPSLLMPSITTASCISPRA